MGSGLNDDVVFSRFNGLSSMNLINSTTRPAVKEREFTARTCKSSSRTCRRMHGQPFKRSEETSIEGNALFEELGRAAL